MRCKIHLIVIMSMTHFFLRAGAGASTHAAWLLPSAAKRLPSLPPRPPDTSATHPRHPSGEDLAASPQSELLHAKFFEKCDVIEEYLELYNLAT